MEKDFKLMKLILTFVAESEHLNNFDKANIFGEIYLKIQPYLSLDTDWKNFKNCVYDLADKYNFDIYK